MSARPSFEKSAVTIDRCKSMAFLKIGSIDESPAEEWKEYQDDSKTKKRPLHLSSREKTKKTMDEMIKVIKKVTSFIE